MSTGNSHIVILSKDLLLGSFLKMVLENLGHRSHSFEDFSEALSQIKQNPPSILLLDPDLPKPDWDELRSTVMGLEMPPAFLFLTDSTDIAWDQSLGKRSPIEQIRRPFDPDEIRRKIRSVFSKMGNGAAVPMEDAGISLAYSPQSAPGSIVGMSKEVKQILDTIDRVADADVTVLIRGESGTGKELVARRIHHQSSRKHQPFIKVLCPAIPDNLLESELFGYEKGSFTGAYTSKPGRFEFANNGTMFLDEIGDIPLSLQSKLLQVLQEGEFSRIGGKADIRVNVRIIAATNKDLEKSIREGSFREDLFYRINVVNVHVPSLRDRREDIPILMHHFLEQDNQQWNKKIKLSNSTIKLFMEYHWPGNIRELKHTLEGIVVLGNEEEVVRQLRPKIGLQKFYSIGRRMEDEFFRSRDGSLKSEIHQSSPRPDGFHVRERRKTDRRRKTTTSPSAKLEGNSFKKISRDAALKVEQEMIEKVLEQTRWNRKEAAKILGISYKALLYKIKLFQKG